MTSLFALLQQRATFVILLACLSASTADPGHQKIRTYRDAAFDSHDYDSVIVDPVVFRPGPKAPAMRDEDLAALTQAYRAKLLESFSSRFSQTQTPGPRTLRVRAAITDVGSPNRALNALTMVAVVAPVSAGGASTEAEVVDSLSGRRLVSLQGAASGGISPKGYLSRYDQAKRAVATLAIQLRDKTIAPVQLASR